MNLEKPSAPARGSQPITPPAELPLCSGAARRSQPAAPPDVITIINRRISQALRKADVFKKLEDGACAATFAYGEAEGLCDLMLEILGKLEEGSPAGND